MKSSSNVLGVAVVLARLFALTVTESFFNRSATSRLDPIQTYNLSFVFGAKNKSSAFALVLEQA
jgi:hypothetical protein